MLWKKEPAMSEFKELKTSNHIDKPSNSRELETIDEPVGSLQELHPEFAKVLHENFLELLGDDFPIEKQISPNCKSKSVEMDKFEEYFRTTNHYENMLLDIARNQLSVSVFDKNGRKYRNHIVQISYEVFQHQQAKVEELQQENLRLAYGNTSYYNQAVKQNEIIDELQKRVDSLEKAEFKLAQVKAILQNNPKLLESILVKKLEQALKGE